MGNEHENHNKTINELCDCVRRVGDTTDESIDSMSSGIA